jgi:hypothetical protein
VLELDVELSCWAKCWSLWLTADVECLDWVFRVWELLWLLDVVVVALGFG